MTRHNQPVVVRRFAPNHTCGIRCGKIEMDQKEINEAEWKNPANWRTGFYYSKKDSRTWVPKRTPWMGWTWNFARAGAWWSLSFLVGLPVLLILLFGTLTHWK